VYGRTFTSAMRHSPGGRPISSIRAERILRKGDEHLACTPLWSTAPFKSWDDMVSQALSDSFEFIGAI